MPSDRPDGKGRCNVSPCSSTIVSWASLSSSNGCLCFSLIYLSSSRPFLLVVWRVSFISLSSLYLLSHGDILIQDWGRCLTYKLANL